MALSVTVGGARSTFDGQFASEVAGVLDQAFGAEGDWEGIGPCHFGPLTTPGSWEDFRLRAAAELGAEDCPNIQALSGEGRGVYLPAQVRAVALPLSSGQPLCCASLHGLRNELSELAGRWDLPLDDEGLRDLLRVDQDPDDGDVADDPAVLTFARLTLAANEAARRDCPLWLVGDE